MFKFNGLKSLSSNVRVIHFVVAIYKNTFRYGFYINSFGSDKFHISKSQFIKFHEEVKASNISFVDHLFCYNDNF